MNKKQNMKKGITLIEIILAIVLIAIILGITIPKLMANSARAEIKAVISSDVKSIVEAATLWRKSSSVSAGSYRKLSASKLNTRLPNTMAMDIPTQLIMSSGLKTGSEVASDMTGPRYVVAWTFATPTIGTTPVANLSIAMDVQKGVDELKWDAKLRDYAIEVFTDVVAELSEGTPVTFGTDFSTITEYDAAMAAQAATAAHTVVCSDAEKAVCFDLITISQ